MADLRASSAGGAGAALVLPAVLTQHEARGCLRQLLDRLSAAGTAAPVQIDAAALERFDSSALAVLLACRRAAPAGLAVRAAPPRLAGLARLYGVATLLGIEAPAPHGAVAPSAS